MKPNKAATSLKTKETFEVEEILCSVKDTPEKPTSKDITAKEFAEIAIKEHKRLLPNKSLPTNVTLGYTNRGWILYGTTSNKTERFSVAADSITGDITFFSHSNSDPSYFTFDENGKRIESKECWITTEYFSQLVGERPLTKGVQLIRKYELNQGQAVIRDLAPDFSYGRIGMIGVSCTIGNDENALNLTVYLDMKTLELVEYSTFENNTTLFSGK